MSDSYRELLLAVLCGSALNEGSDEAVADFKKWAADAPADDFKESPELAEIGLPPASPHLASMYLTAMQEVQRKLWHQKFDPDGLVEKFQAGAKP